MTPVVTGGTTSSVRNETFIVHWGQETHFQHGHLIRNKADENKQNHATCVLYKSVAILVQTQICLLFKMLESAVMRTNYVQWVVVWISSSKCMHYFLWISCTCVRHLNPTWEWWSPLLTKETKEVKQKKRQKDQVMAWIWVYKTQLNSFLELCEIICGRIF